MIDLFCKEIHWKSNEKGITQLENSSNETLTLSTKAKLKQKTITLLSISLQNC